MPVQALKYAETFEEDEEQETRDAPEPESDSEVFDPPPPPPDWMGFEAKMEWLRCAKDLHERGRLIGGVISLLESYCITVGYIRELEKMLQDDGKIIGGKPHPAYRMLMDTLAHSKQLASEIGFTRKEGVDYNQDKKDMAAGNWDKSLLA